MEVAKIQVGGTCACAYEKKTIRAGMVGVTVSFAFDEYWDGLNKIAVYRCGGVVRDEYLEGDTGTIPAEVLTKSGFDLEVGVYGTDAEKQIAIPTCWANLGVVRPGADPSGDPAADPELPFWAKVQEWLKTRFVKTVNGIAADENGNVKIETGKVNVDPTLTKEGFAADAKAVGEELGKKEPRVLRVTIANDNGGYTSSHSASEIAAHYNAGGLVIAVDNGNRFYNVRWVNDSSVTFENTYIDNVYGDVYFAYFKRYEVFEDKSVTKTSKGSNIIASDDVGQWNANPVTGKGVYDYAVPIPETAEVGQTIAVKSVNEYGKPTEWEAVNMPEMMIVNITAKYNPSINTFDYIPDHTLEEIREHLLGGGVVVACSFGGAYSGLYKMSDVSGYDGGATNLDILKNINSISFDAISIENKTINRHTLTITSAENATYKWATYQTPFEGLNAESGYALVADGIRGSANGNIPYSWKYVPMPQPVAVDSYLSEYSTNAVQNSVVTKALADKAKKPLIINADDAPTTGSNSVSGIPIFTIDYTPADLKAYADAGGSVTVVRYNRHYAMYDATEETAKFRFIEATDMQVDWYHAVLDANGAVSITKTTHKSRMETTTGGAVGQIPIIKSLDSKGCPASFGFGDMPKGIPACSASDDGKFLRVVGGVAAWDTIPSAEGVGF